MTEQPVPNEPFWGILELLGHVRLAGRVSEVEMSGEKLGRIDVPQGDVWLTRYFGGRSVYQIAVCDEATARAVAARCRPEPVHAYEPPAIAVRKEGDDEEFDDDPPF
jgi:hypothetical protein